MNNEIFSRIRKFQILSEFFILNLILYSSAMFVLAADDTSDSKFRFGYNVEINNIPLGAKKVTVFIPVPQSFDHQKIENLAISSPYPYDIIKDSEYGNLAARTSAENLDTNQIDVHMTFTMDRQSIAALDGRYKGYDQLSKKLRKRYLSPDRMVPLDGPVLDACREAVNDNGSDLERARDIYDYVVSTMTYDKSGIGWGRGDVIYACNARHGNCTDFHSLFIGMARASGIPARFIIGFPIGDSEKQGEIAGYHCWAEFYTDELGWVPVDASEASKNPEKKEYYFGNLDSHRVAFTVGRDIMFDDKELKEPLNYFVYPRVFVDGHSHTDFEKHFRFIID
jgi:transglutaminase-like putative cysteine protease